MSEGTECSDGIFGDYERLNTPSSRKSRPESAFEGLLAALTSGIMFECLSCGYFYVPEDGVPGAGVSPGTRFEDLPEGFVCPACGSAWDQFVAATDESAAEV